MYISVGSGITGIHMLSFDSAKHIFQVVVSMHKTSNCSTFSLTLGVILSPCSPPSGYLLEYHCSFNVLFHDDWWSYAGHCSSYLLYNKSSQNSGIQVGLFWHRQRRRGLLCYHWAVNGIVVTLDGVEVDSVPLGGDETQLLAWSSLTPPRLAWGAMGTFSLHFSESSYVYFTYKA